MASPRRCPSAGANWSCPDATRFRPRARATIPLQQAIVVPSGGFQLFEFELEELPGRVSIDLQPKVPFDLFVNGKAAATDVDGMAEIAAGTQQLRIETERYLPVEQSVNVLGKGQAQQIGFVLKPAWANARIASEPCGRDAAGGW